MEWNLVTLIVTRNHAIVRNEKIIKIVSRFSNNKFDSELSRGLLRTNLSRSLLPSNDNDNFSILK